MKLTKKILVFLLVTLAAMQFFRPEKNIAAAPFPNDIATIYPRPAEVDTILKKACNNCHSNNTNYPWYNNFQPISGWLHDHVKEGKREVNFNEFASYRIGKQYRKLLEIKEQVEQDEMPLSSYTFIHTNAKLTKQEKDVLINWTETLRSTVRANYPADSLVIKRKLYNE